jgi:hypothetical protein
MLGFLDALCSKPPTHLKPLADEAAARDLRIHTYEDDRLDWARLPYLGAQWSEAYEALWAWFGRNNVHSDKNNGPNEIVAFEPVRAKYLR